MTYCHCSTCRQHSGRSYLTFGHFHNDAVTFKASATPTTAASRGEPEIKQTHSGMATRGSCGSCGAPLFMKYHCKPDGVDIVLSTVDEGDMRRIKPGLEKEHIFVEQDPGASEEDPGDGVERHVGFDGGFQRRLDDWQKRGSPRRPDV
ncbi:MAG: hypothetical protein M1828_001865 [Chrysothrix sp. TS-e1954]|nr:MAG: hypothetical protein M1828_001865 [Chrysothrix sp. TS-e1954]